MSKEKSQGLAEKNLGASRRKKKFIKEILESLMLMDVKDDKVKEKLKHFGIPENEMTLQMAMCVSLVQQAVNGNIKSFQVIGDYLQQNPKFRRRQRKSGKYYIYMGYPSKA